ncbi:MAG: uroporphyrinogen decarboxylase family protein [Phycisphaerae bacterium]
MKPTTGQQTQREIFDSVLTFADPPRIGFALPQPYPNDTVHAGRRRPVDRTVTPAPGELRRWVDEWGCTWASLTEFDKGEVVEPAITDWSDLDDYQPPDLGRADDYADVAAAFAADPHRYRIGHLPGFTFNVARKLRRLDNYLCDLVLQPDRVRRLNELVRAELIKAIDRLADAGADAVMFPEDWGTQGGLMISPEMWREFFAPEFEALAGQARRRGMIVIMHSCGKMTDIIEDLISLGVGCLQFDQPRVHGIDLLAERFGGRVAFWCPVDTQRTLQTRDVEKIRGDAKEMIEKLGGFPAPPGAEGKAQRDRSAPRRPRGGFVAGNYPTPEAIGITQELQNIACEAFVEYGGG